MYPYRAVLRRQDLALLLLVLHDPVGRGDGDARHASFEASQIGTDLQRHGDVLGKARETTIRRRRHPRPRLVQLRWGAPAQRQCRSTGEPHADDVAPPVLGHAHPPSPRSRLRPGPSPGTAGAAKTTRAARPEAPAHGNRRRGLVPMPRPCGHSTGEELGSSPGQRPGTRRGPRVRTVGAGIVPLPLDSATYPTNARARTSVRPAGTPGSDARPGSAAGRVRRPGPVPARRGRRRRSAPTRRPAPRG